MTSGAFGLLTHGGFGSDLPAGGVGAISGSVSALPTNAPSKPLPSPTDVIVPPAPSWNVPRPFDPTPGQRAPWPAHPPLGPAPAPTPPPGPSAPETTRGTTPGSTTVTVPAATITPAPTHPTPTPTHPASPTPAPTTPPSTTPTGGSGASTPAPGPAATVGSTYELFLADQIGGRIGYRTGSAAGFQGDPSGTLPYAARVATTAIITSPDPGAPKRAAAAIGVDAAGAAHLTLFGDGKPLDDRVIPATWAGATALVAWYHQSDAQVTVLAFLPDGSAVRQTYAALAAGRAPTPQPAEVVARGVSGVSAAALARLDADAQGSARSLWAYVVSGPRLVLLKVPAVGVSTSSELVADGLSGVVTLARLSTGTPGAGGVAAWTGSGQGRLFYGPDAFGPLRPAGATAELPG